jgi:hypothetical protein
MFEKILPQEKNQQSAGGKGKPLIFLFTLTERIPESPDNLVMCVFSWEKVPEK